MERIRGKLLMIGADDDTLWDAGKYVRRMEARLNRLPHECDFETAVYQHGTHFVFPESMLKMILPVGSELVVKHAFKAAREYPRECRAAREDIDRRMTNAIEQWKRA